MSGELCKLKEQRQELVRHIKELEKKRLENNVLNTKRLDPLYGLLDSLDDVISKLEDKENGK